MSRQPYVFAVSGMRGIASATVRSAASCVEGVPPEFAGYIGQVIRQAGVRTFSVEISVLGAGCEGGWASIEVVDLQASGHVCASWATSAERPYWTQRFHHGRVLQPRGWTLDDDGWLYRKPLGHIDHQRSLRSAVADVMMTAQAVFGLLPPWLWYLSIGLPTHGRPDGAGASPMIDLRRLGNGGITVPPAGTTIFPGCSEEGHIAHSIGECDVHAPCVGLLGCRTSERLTEPCGGCDGLETLMRRPTD